VKKKLLKSVKTLMAIDLGGSPQWSSYAARRRYCIGTDFHI